jgi:hypothetical protein
MYKKNRPLKEDEYVWSCVVAAAFKLVGAGFARSE